MQQCGRISALEADKIWKVTRKSASQGLKQVREEGLVVEVFKGPFDPRKVFILTESGS